MTRPRPRPSVLFWCQHSLGMGHLARALNLAAALVRDTDVVLVSGGRRPEGVEVPPGVTVLDLPPLGHTADGKLVSQVPGTELGVVCGRRREILLAALDDVRPDVLLLELYPFGRRKFEFELLPLLDAARSAPGGRPRVVCSLRDILVTGRPRQQDHDDRVAGVLDTWFDAVLVHADPRFARLDSSFRPRRPLRVPVHHTGFVAPPPIPDGPPPRRRRLVVSAGGGVVGADLVRCAIAVHRDLHARTGLTTTVVLGPLAPEAAWRDLQEQAARSPVLDAVRAVPDLAREIAASALSLSQAGYNTCMDLVRAGTPAVVVPYGGPEEDEQRVRAARLAELGLVSVLPARDLRPQRLLTALLATAGTRPTPVLLDLDGAARSAAVLRSMARPVAGAPAARPEPQVVR